MTLVRERKEEEEAGGSDVSKGRKEEEEAGESDVSKGEKRRRRRSRGK